MQRKRPSLGNLYQAWRCKQIRGYIDRSTETSAKTIKSLLIEKVNNINIVSVA
jgi:hypothetical protein